MSKPSDDLSALFRSLRPDETSFQESTGTVARDAEQRWPLFKAVAPVKPQETPALSAQERQRWVNQEKPQAGGRKPALSLPGLSDKMSKGLDKMSARAVKNTAAVKPAVRREPENAVVERAVERPAERPRGVRAAAPPQVSPPQNQIASAVKPAAVNAVDPDVLDKKSAVLAPAPVVEEREPLATVRGDDSLKSIFSRLETKAEVVVKPAGTRSSFLDRLGKR